MRTFHVGGVASGKSEKSSHESKRAGKVVYRDIKLLQKPDGTYVVMNRNGKIVIQDDKGRDREKYPVTYGTNLKVADGSDVAEGTILADWDPYNDPIIAETNGVIAYEDLENGITMREEQDFNTGLTKTVVIPTRDAKMSPQLLITEEGKKGRKTAKKLERGEAVYHLPVNAYIEVPNGALVNPGDVLAKVPRAARKTKDITGGLPRISDLFEARKTKNPAKVSEISGIVSITSEGKNTKSKRMITVTPVDGGEAMEPIQIPKEKHINVHDGDTVEAGEALIEGTIDPHDILRISGEVAVAKFLVQEVQRVYKLQGVPINDKHIEIIVKQMLKKRKVIDPGDTMLMKDELVEKEKLEKINRITEEKGLKPATWDVVLLGITKAALNTESFFSAASFQETTKVLTNASVERKKDILRGIKENIIIGKIIPAGTGFPKYSEANYEIKIPGMENAEIALEDEDIATKTARTSFRASRRLADIDMEGAFDFSNISDGMEGGEEGFSETDDIPSGKDEE